MKIENKRVREYVVHLFQEDFRGKPGCVFVWMGERRVVRECLWRQGRASTDAEKTKEIWKVK